MQAGRDAGEGCRHTRHSPTKRKHQPQPRHGSGITPSPSPSKPTATRQTPTSKSGVPAPGPPQLSPGVTSPPVAGLPRQQAAGKAPYQAQPANRRGPEGPGGARADPREGGGRGKVFGSIPTPGSGPRPGTTRCTVGVQPSDHGGKSRPAHATAPAAFPLPAHGRVHRRSHTHRRETLQTKRLRKETEKARRSRQVENRRGCGCPHPGTRCQGAPRAPHLTRVPCCAASTGVLCRQVPTWGN